MKRALGIMMFPLVCLGVGIPLNEGVEISFIAKATGNVRIEGKSNQAQGNLEISNGVVTGSPIVQLTTLTTGISLRDSHMKEKYLQVDKFPEAKLTLSSQDLSKCKAQGMLGKLNLHGVEKTVQGTAQLREQTLEFNFEILLSDFQITQPSFMGISVKDNVELNVKVPIKKPHSNEVHFSNLMSSCK